MMTLVTRCPTGGILQPPVRKVRRFWVQPPGSSAEGSAVMRRIQEQQTITEDILQRMVQPGKGVYGRASAFSGDLTRDGGYFEANGRQGEGVHAKSDGEFGKAVYGYATGSFSVGVTGVVVSPFGTGVFGYNSATEGDYTGYGGYFQADGPQGVGAAGSAGGTYGKGISGTASGSMGIGVYGYTSNTGDGFHHAGHFRSEGSFGTGVYAYANGYDFYAAGPGSNYAPFTGSHEVKFAQDMPEEIVRGMIVSVNGRTEQKKG